MDTKDTQEAIEAFRRYTQAFQSLDPRAVVPHFHEPALMISPRGVAALPTGAAVEQVYARVMAELPAQGYARTEFSSLVGRRLSNDTAVVSGSGVWKKASGESFNSFGITYTLRRVGEAWRIIVAIIHDPDAGG
jgi:ketosteroid isomerase-like protein